MNNKNETQILEDFAKLINGSLVEFIDNPTHSDPNKRKVVEVGSGGLFEEGDCLRAYGYGSNYIEAMADVMNQIKEIKNENSSNLSTQK